MYCIKYMSGKDGQTPPPPQKTIQHLSLGVTERQVTNSIHGATCPDICTVAGGGKNRKFPQKHSNYCRFTKLILLPIYEEYEQIDHQ